jgi:hypothetical protein
MVSQTTRSSLNPVPHRCLHGRKKYFFRARCPSHVCVPSSWSFFFKCTCAGLHSTWGERVRRVWRCMDTRNGTGVPWQNWTRAYDESSVHEFMFQIPVLLTMHVFFTLCLIWIGTLRLCVCMYVCMCLSVYVRHYMPSYAFEMRSLYLTLCLCACVCMYVCERHILSHVIQMEDMSENVPM